MIPCVVLVQTQMPENIGATARAMTNFGLHELRLVAPREEWPNQRAYDLAAHAGAVLDKARVFASTREAVADCQRIYAATARGREMVKPVYMPAQAMARIASENVPTAFLFGPERTGLTNEDVAIADAIVTIPTASELTSLNVAQSVVVMAYQWFAREPQANAGAATTGPDASAVAHKNPFATKDELRHFFDHLERELDAVDFWKVAYKKPKMWLNLRNIFARAELTDQEVRTLHGVIAELSKGRKD